MTAALIGLLYWAWMKGLALLANGVLKEARQLNNLKSWKMFYIRR
jgi:hypothetical protein